MSWSRKKGAQQMERKFPRKLYKCNRCRSEKVAWWNVGGRWKLIPATLDPNEGTEKAWLHEEGSPVYCDPTHLHDLDCTGPTPPQQGGDRGYEPLPTPEEVRRLQGEQGEQRSLDTETPQQTQGEGKEDGTEGAEDENDPAKPLIDAITKRVLKKIKPDVDAAVNTAGNAEDKALEALKKAGEAQPKGEGPQVTIHTVEWVPAPEAPKRNLGVVHKEFPRLLFWVQMGEPTYLSGQPGGGKTEAGRMVALTLERPFGLISLNPGTPESRLIGYMDAGGAYRPTLYRTLYEKGGVFVIDEMDNASAAMLTTINSHTNGLGAFPDGVVERHKDFVLIATGNTAGRGGTMNHTERRALDAATLDRFVFLDWPYDEGLESVMVSSVLTDDEKAGKWLGWIREVREFCKVNHPRIIVSPRAAVKGAKAIAHDRKLCLKGVVEEVLFKGVESATVKAILATKPLPVL